MSPNPYSKKKLSDEISRRSVPNRLNLLLFLILVQIGLTIILLIKLPDAWQPQQVIEDNVTQRRSASVLGDFPSRQEHGIPSVVTGPTPVSGGSDSLDDTLTVEPVRVQVLNGCGVSGLAAKIKRHLERNGFIVNGVGNADREYRYSLVIARSDDPTDARAVAASLAIVASNIQTTTDLPPADFDVTVIVGKDYQRLTFDR